MSRFDVFRAPRGNELVLDCQAEILDDLPTRFMVPLIPVEALGRFYSRLNPMFRIEDREYAMATQMALTLPVAALTVHVTNLADDHARIMDALDMLLTGY